ncbi:transmembrane protein 230-like [Danaus plexippus]|uniref:Transmembrane protein 230 n=1 Tax=Danaus plexippus plexippus TaxID=278856 RepID=A0A212FJU9_DANPL|nr:transmembrane protein 230-like [Danaus plexippus]OWR53980.1 hypothetical protein KGM_202593 [Danaus plexippus plexippus]
MSRFRLRRQYDGYVSVPHDDSGFSDAQFEVPPLKIPWKALSLAAFLFVVGTSLLIVGSLIVTGQIDTKYSDRLWPMIVLGCIMFLPGAYHMRIAYYAYKEYPGYSFGDIPEFE